MLGVVLSQTFNADQLSFSVALTKTHTTSWVNSGTKAWPRFGTTPNTQRSGAPCLQTVPAFRCAPIAARALTSMPDPRIRPDVPSTV